jgi:hypothetical protein
MYSEYHLIINSEGILPPIQIKELANILLYSHHYLNKQIIACFWNHLYIKSAPPMIKYAFTHPQKSTIKMIIINQKAELTI